MQGKKYSHPGNYKSEAFRPSKVLAALKKIPQNYMARLLSFKMRLKIFSKSRHK